MEDKHVIRAVMAFAIFALSIVLIVYILNFSGHQWGGPEQWGQFGDYMGGVLNPLLGFVTVALLVWSITIQNKELDNSSNELKLAREEMKKGNEIYKSQKEMQLRASLRDQLFSQFKEYLELFNEDMSKDLKRLDMPHLDESIGFSAAAAVIQIQRKRDGINHNSSVAGVRRRWNEDLKNAAFVLRGDIKKAHSSAKALIHYFDSSLLTSQLIDEFSIHMDRVRELALLPKNECDGLIDELHSAVDERAKIEGLRFEWHTPRRAVSVDPTA